MREEYIIKESHERVDLATSDSTQYITRHVQLSLRHVDPRGRMRLMTLKFGILKGLRFYILWKLYKTLSPYSLSHLRPRTQS